jgi:hypothetical protein
MVISHAIGPRPVNTARAKEKIREIEHANKAFRDAVLNKINQNAAPNIGDEKKREKALREVQEENPSFHEAVKIELSKLLV